MDWSSLCHPNDISSDCPSLSSKSSRDLNNKSDVLVNSCLKHGISSLVLQGEGISQRCVLSWKC